MRKWLIFIILLLFNFLFIYGINQTNILMFNNNFMIYLYPQPEEIKEEEPEVVKEEEEEEVDINFNGESVEQIGKKMDKYFEKTLLEGYGEYIAKSSIKKSVNPYLIAGIMLENTGCKNECSIILKECNNVSGIKGSPGCFGGTYKEYDGIDGSISDLIGMISQKFYTPEMQVPNKMYKDYGKTSTWAFIVSKYMEEIKKVK